MNDICIPPEHPLYARKAPTSLYPQTYRNKGCESQRYGLRHRLYEIYSDYKYEKQVLANKLYTERPHITLDNKYLSDYEVLLRRTRTESVKSFAKILKDFEAWLNLQKSVIKKDTYAGSSYVSFRTQLFSLTFSVYRGLTNVGIQKSTKQVISITTHTRTGTTFLEEMFDYNRTFDNLEDCIIYLKRVINYRHASLSTKAIRSFISSSEACNSEYFEIDDDND